MPTGPDHYREAERLLAGRPITTEEREQGIEAGPNWPPSRMDLLAAQVHATLALAAATALPAVRVTITETALAWMAAVEGVTPDNDDEED
jgi:hypothetical protein